VMSGDLSEGLTAETLFGQSISFSLEGGASITDPAGRTGNITAVDIEAQNGVVHVIDKVILPDLTTNVSERMKPAMEFYPNPATGYITVRSENTGSLLHITNISGKQVFIEKLVQPVQRIDLTGINPGIYFLSVENSNSRVTEKLIVR
jgi:transforming growth factor-beta-induced protein